MFTCPAGGNGDETGFTTPKINLGAVPREGDVVAIGLHLYRVRSVTWYVQKRPPFAYVVVVR